jgi:hypothetical protein
MKILMDSILEGVGESDGMYGCGCRRGFDWVKSEISRGQTHTLRFVIRVNVAYTTIFPSIPVKECNPTVLLLPLLLPLSFINYDG